MTSRGHTKSHYIQLCSADSHTPSASDTARGQCEANSTQGPTSHPASTATLLNMELSNWSLNAIDQAFSTRRVGPGEPNCPDGTFSAGYAMDGWSKWRVVCLSVISIEDIEDIYIFAIMIVGFLGLAGCLYPMYRKLRKLVSDASGNREVQILLRRMRADILGTKEELAMLRADLKKPKANANDALEEEDEP